MKKFVTGIALVSTLGATTLTTDLARACGGCFHAVTESTVVTGHRMVVSISKSQAVLWDQIQYAGDPTEFSWVLPVKKGAFVEVATDAFFEVLEGGTGITVQAPPEGCVIEPDDGFSCGSRERFSGGTSEQANAAPGIGFGDSSGGGGEPPPPVPPVEVVHQGTVGPYETVTLATENPNALAEWLADNGYVLPDEVKPIIDAYVAEDFDFIALKLRPDEGVSAMKPVRVISPGSNYTLPLRMVAAGVGESVDLVLYVIGEGRYEPAGFANATIVPKLLSWDFKEDRSDYAVQRLSILQSNQGRSWLTAYSRQGPLLGSISDPLTGGSITYTVGGGAGFSNTLADAYILQGFDNGEEVDAEQEGCRERIRNVSPSDVVTSVCDAEGNCSSASPGQTDARRLACGELDDVAVALEGMHPEDVVVTRLEAVLPVEALDADLRLEASAEQDEVLGRYQASLKTNPCWDQQDSVSPLIHNAPKHRLPPEGLVLLTLGAAGIALAERRRRRSTKAQPWNPAR